MQIHHEIFTILLYDFQSDGKDGLIKIQLPQGHHPLEAAINILVSLSSSSVRPRCWKRQTWRSSASSAVDLWLPADQGGILGGKSESIVENLE